MATKNLNYKAISFIVGVSAWLFGTLPFTFFGHLFFITENTLLMMFLYASVIPILFFITNWVYKNYCINNEDILRSTIIMVVPGLLLDVLVFSNYKLVFPLLDPLKAGMLSAYVLWIYGVTLVIGLIKHNIK